MNLRVSYYENKISKYGRKILCFVISISEIEKYIPMKDHNFGSNYIIPHAMHL